MLESRNVSPVLYRMRHDDYASLGDTTGVDLQSMGQLMLSYMQLVCCS